MTGLWERMDDLEGLRAFFDQGRQIVRDRYSEPNKVSGLRDAHSRAALS
jgi:hypothetical protein